MAPLRLLAIIEAYSITGPAKNLLDFARLAKAFNVSTSIATFTRSNEDNQFLRTVRELGLPLEIIPERGPFDREVPRLLRVAVKRLQPDILQTHAVKSHFLTRSAGLPAVAPWVAFHHGYTWPSIKAKLYNQLDRWSLRAARKVLTVSVPFQEELASLGVARGKIEIIHNAIPPEWGAADGTREAAADLRERTGIPADRKVILIVGRLSKEKDHLTLLEAVNRLRPAINPQLVIVGDGPEKSRIEERIRFLHLDQHVTFTGHQSSAAPWYGIADVAVLSSLSEGSPNALLEAMATNVPLAATAVGGVPEIVTSGESALLFAPGDAAAMSDALGRLLTDTALAARLRHRSRELIVERHAPEARVAKLISIYRSLLSQS